MFPTISSKVSPKLNIVVPRNIMKTTLAKVAVVCCVFAAVELEARSTHRRPHYFEKPPPPKFGYEPKINNKLSICEYVDWRWQWHMCVRRMYCLVVRSMRCEGVNVTWQEFSCGLVKWDIHAHTCTLKLEMSTECATQLVTLWDGVGTLIVNLFA